MGEVLQDSYEAAAERGRVDFETAPHASNARYDPASRMIVVELYNGCVFSFPARELQGLEQASDAELAQVEVVGVGYGLHWEAFDADFFVRGLMAGWFGDTQHMGPRRARLRAILESVADRRDAA